MSRRKMYTAKLQNGMKHRSEDQDFNPERRVETEKRFVYYVGKYDQAGKEIIRIKIGSTSRLATRLAQLEDAAGEKLVMLAIEDEVWDGPDSGGPRIDSVEEQRHCEFNHLRLPYGEWFKPGPDLLIHIETLRRLHGIGRSP